MEQWGKKFASSVQERAEGQNDFALDLADLVQQKAAEFNDAVPEGFSCAVDVEVKGTDIEISNGYKKASAIASLLPGAIFIRVATPATGHTFEAALHNSARGFEPDNLPGECADPEALAEWMIHEIFEP